MMNLKLFSIDPSTLSKTEENNANQFESPTEFLQVYFNFAYFFYLSPYKFIKKLNETVFVIETNIRHKVFCGFVHLVLFHRILFLFFEDRVTRTVTYFGFVLTVFLACLYKTMFLFSIWNKKNEFLAILNEIHGNDVNYHNKSGSKKHTWIISVILCVSCLTFAIICTVLGERHLLLSQWSPAMVIQRYADFSRFMFMFSSQYNPQTSLNSTTLTSDQQLCFPTSIDVGLALLQTFIQFYKQFLSYYADLFILFCGLTFGSMSTLFITSISSNHGSNPSVPDNIYCGQVLQNYNALKTLTDKINVTIGPIFLLSLLEAISHYVMYVGDILIETDYLVRGRYLTFFVGSLATLFILARAAHQIQAFEDWLADENNRKLVPTSQTVIIVSQLGRHRVGISAMGLFTITYGLIGTVVSFVLTYAVLILQLKK